MANQSIIITCVCVCVCAFAVVFEYENQFNTKSLRVAERVSGKENTPSCEEVERIIECDR